MGCMLTRNAAPRAKNMPASVTRNGGREDRWLRCPVIAPNETDTARPIQEERQEAEQSPSLAAPAHEQQGAGAPDEEEDPDARGIGVRGRRFHDLFKHRAEPPSDGR